MDNEAFRKLVHEMRAAQRQYFALPYGHAEKQFVMKRAKALEKRVDDALAIESAEPQAALEF